MFESRREGLENLQNLEELILRGEPEKLEHRTLYIETVESWCEQLSANKLSGDELTTFFLKTIAATTSKDITEILAKSFLRLHKADNLLFQDIPIISQTFSHHIFDDKGRRSELLGEATLEAIAISGTAESARVLAHIAAGKTTSQSSIPQSSIPQNSIPQSSADDRLRKKAVLALGAYGSIALPFISGIEQFVYEKGIRGGDETSRSSGIKVAHTIEEDELSRRQLLAYPLLGFVEFPGEVTATPSITPGELQHDMRFRFLGSESGFGPGRVPSECRIRSFFSVLGEPILVISEDRLSYGRSMKEQISTHIARLTMFMGAESLPRIFEVSKDNEANHARELEVSLSDHTVRIRRDGFDPNLIFEREFGIKAPSFIAY